MHEQLVHSVRDTGVQEVSSAFELADILWRNRAGASLAARRIATQVLTQSAARIQ